MLRPTAVLFDLDDTLIDRRALIQTYAGVFAEQFKAGLQPITASQLTEQIITADRGGYRPRPQVATALAAGLPWTANPDPQIVLQHWMRHFPDCTVARAHALMVVKTLHRQGIIVGVVTNGAARGQNRKIDTIGLRSYLSTIVVSETAGIKKPDPQIFNSALAEIQQPSANVWFVGDHPVNDIIGAAGVGMTPVWLRGMHAWPTDHALQIHRIDGLDELLNMLPSAD